MNIDRQVFAQRRLGQLTWVAVLEKTIIGFTSLGSEGHLDMLFVHPAYQGKGVASLLLAAAEQDAANNGVLLLFTEASITARPFFEKKGFQFLSQQHVFRF